ncbi:hypothetical protein [Amycolatopsis sp. NPDC021455]|uniref:hypothetical protein n=1 Tax=Amycolatopsis sp. NPDC021455 TaxID=3154901 RepID=UPI0033E998EE
MGFCLEAVIAGEAVLRRLAGNIPIVPLHGPLSMLPMTDEYFDAVSAPGAAELEGVWKAPVGFGDSLAACSELGPVAYVEADYSGGVGSQSAQVWHRGTVILGPLRIAVGERPPSGGSPISQALRALGVRRGRHLDEFDAVRLGRYRRTEEWLR